MLPGIYPLVLQREIPGFIEFYAVRKFYFPRSLQPRKYPGMNFL